MFCKNYVGGHATGEKVVEEEEKEKGKEKGKEEEEEVVVVVVVVKEEGILGCLAAANRRKTPMPAKRWWCKG